MIIALSDGDNEKNATSEPEINAENNSNKINTTMPKTIPGVM